MIPAFISRCARSPLWSRCFWLYMIVALLLWGAIDRDRAFLNRMNVLKDVEENLEEFLYQGTPLDTDSLRWAIRYYRKLHRQAPENSLYLGDLGFCYFYLHQYDEAIRAYRQAIEREGQLYTYHWDLGMIYFSRGQFAEARKSLLAALNRIPRSVHYFMEIVKQARDWTGKDFDAFAIGLTQQAQKDEEAALLKVADIYLRERDYQGMVTVTAGGLKSHPYSERLHYQAGLGYFHLNDYLRAVSHFSRAIELKPDFADAYRYRGLSLRQLNLTGGAEKDLATAKALSRDVGREEDEVKLHLNIELRLLRKQFAQE